MFLFLSMCCTYVAAQEPQPVRHKVRWMETLYSIARKYKVDAVDIAVLNNLNNGQVKKGQILLIPVTTVTLDSFTREPEAADTTQLEIAEGPLENETTPEDCSLYTPSDAYIPVLSVILPVTGNKSSDSFVEFYQGVLLAARKMQEQGMNARIQCFDWNAYSPADELLSGDLLAESDVIIGPVYSAEIGSALAYFDRSDVKVVSPLDASSNVWIEGHPNFFQIPTQASVQHQAVVNALDPRTATIWVISETGEMEVSSEIKNILEKNVIPYRNFTYDVLDGRTVTATLEGLLGSQTRNQIIIASQNEAFVSDAMRNLHLLYAYNQIPIELFGLSKWRSFETLDLAALHQLQVVLPLSVYVDYSQPDVQEFVRTFREIYFTEPTNYAFQGYDAAYYFLNALYKYGPHFEGCLGQMKVQLLQSDYGFERDTEEEGFSNRSVRLIRYLPDYTISLFPGIK